MRDYNYILESILLESQTKSSLTKKELENLSEIRDKYYDLIADVLEKKGYRMLMQQAIKLITEKNASVLLSQLPGKQLLFNKDAEEFMFKYLNINRNELEQDIADNPFYRSVNLKQRIEQLTVAIPFLLTARYLYLNKKQKEALFFYLMSYYKPYASIIYKYFQYPPNEDRMRYTIENLSNRYSIKKLGSIQKVIEDMAETSFNNYTKGKKQLITCTDKDLYEIFVSGVYSRLNQMIKNIASQYYKNVDKYMPYEFENLDSDSEDYRVLDNISLQKSKLAKAAAVKMVTNPLDYTLINEIVARKDAKSGSRVNIYGIEISQKAFVATLQLIKENNYHQFEKMFDAIITNFLMERPGTSLSEIKSPKFRRIALDIYKTSNTSSKSINVIKDILEEWASQHEFYLTRGKTQRNAMKKAIYAYFAFFLQKV